MTTKSQTINQVYRRWQWTGKITQAGGLLILTITVLLLSAGQSAQSNLSIENSNPGKLVNVEGHLMHINCLGEGSPTVVMESGLGGFSIHWELVQADIARITRVCTYDRSGYGWSEPGPYPRTSERIVSELHTLLANAGVEKPYVLVGHSFGGLNTRLFAHHYPDEVAALLLVDSVHEDQDGRLPKYKEAREQMARQFRFLAFLREIGIVALFTEKIPNPGLPDEVFSEWRPIVATTKFFETSRAESLSMAASFADFKQANVSDLGDIPLIVLSRGIGMPLAGFSETENQEYEEIWQEMQVDLAGLSSNSQHIIAEKSGHDIALQQPEIIVEAVHQLVNDASIAEANPSSELIMLPPVNEEPAAVPAIVHSATPTPTSPVVPTPTPTIVPIPTLTVEPIPTEPPGQAEFTLRTDYRNGKMIYVGVGGDIDGVVNPDLIVQPNTLVRAILVNGDGMNHDLYFPDFSAKTAKVGRREETAEVTFLVDANQVGVFVYYCTLPGHREAGQEGKMQVVEQ